MVKHTFITMGIVIMTLITCFDLVEANVKAGVLIDDISYEDPQNHTTIIITLSFIGDKSLIKDYKIDIKDQNDNIRVSGKYPNLENVRKLRLSLPSSLPSDTYLVELTAYDINNEELWASSFDFPHTSAQITVNAPATSADPIHAEYPFLLVTGVVVIVGGYWVLRLRRYKDAVAHQRVRSLSDVKDIQQGTIFISYSRKDWGKYVEPMLDYLESEGLSVWVDQHLLKNGDDWMDKIDGALQACDAMILCVSPDALKSKFVKLEYRYFFTNNKRLYPLICRNSGNLPAELQVIQFYTYDRLAELAHEIKAELATQYPTIDADHPKLANVS